MMLLTGSLAAFIGWFGRDQQTISRDHFIPMPTDDTSREQRAENLLWKLVDAGWIDHLGTRDADGRYIFHWTEKGQVLASFMNDIDGELQLGPEGWIALCLICKSHPPE